MISSGKPIPRSIAFIFKEPKQEGGYGIKPSDISSDVHSILIDHHSNDAAKINELMLRILTREFIILRAEIKADL